MDELDNQYNFLFYQGKGGSTKIQIFLDQRSETIWTTQKGMSEIFDVDRSVITKHLSNIYQQGELEKDRTCAKFAQVQKEGNREVRREIEYYNLDAIISVGYRVNSQKATDFRIWATDVLKEYLIKGFVLDDERLKQGKDAFGKDYFDELLERIREIRASERRFYQKITDIYAQCSIDYDPYSPITQLFYATVQNKLHYAIHNCTAAELIEKRADSTKPNMGLTTYKNADKGGKILKSDVSNAKNYLKEEELNNLNRIVSMYLDFAENLAKRQKVMKMTDWANRLDAFLEFNEYDILNDAGKVSAKVAKQIAEKEYEKFRIIQDREYKSDFDKIVDEIKIIGKLPPKKISDLDISIRTIQDKQTLNDDSIKKKGKKSKDKNDDLESEAIN
ncbi:virulence RhuM family protein [Dysgonomonas sp. 520]|uniref:virulence RhuM family protein n=1 Tax=Dysgonomonas sp. 520 TaxID=2302931 RepID=UPI0013D0147A|nr:virulence RhuM family protein [Dysgonomonas sp. 520]NDW10539.1 cell filamentation protein Fic [Dysgonomonas sp. 520]